jgi:hypothetical protein
VTSVAFTLRLRTKNPGNTRPSNTVLSAVIARRERTDQHESACLQARIAMRLAKVTPVDLVPAVVTLTRVSTGRLDEHDGLRSALKHVVDGVAEALCVDDGRGAVTWQYRQRSDGRGKFGIDVEIASRT